MTKTCEEFIREVGAASEGMLASDLLTALISMLASVMAHRAIMGQEGLLLAGVISDLAEKFTTGVEIAAQREARGRLN